MNTLTEWTEENDAIFEEAYEAIYDDMGEEAADAWVSQDDYTFDGLIEHYSSLYGITEEALRHEWNLRQGGAR